MALVEWGDLAAPALGDDVLVVTLTQPDAPAGTSAQRRTIVISGRGSWAGRSDEVAEALAPVRVETA